MHEYPDIRGIDKWVVIEIPTLNPHYFDTFKEALNSPIKGHLMTNKFYKQCYEK